ncbi:TM0106 family RecB-like putative nuclease [Glaciibacter sp. 2TAF33]|uniref:TM0106 family RecB-like putative nuclease n=1 Tax=Glaciibacter sp. 2TAF33 TaxID=3233015 RepID=UPI003F92A3AC
MFLLDGDVVTSASDLTAASKCEFAFLRKLDAKLGRIDAVPDTADAMLERTSRLGDEHEARVLEGYRRRFGSGVAEIARPEQMDRAALDEVTAETVRAFSGTADVVFQATFFDDGFGTVSVDASVLVAESVDAAGSGRTIVEVSTSAGCSVAFIGFADFIVRQPDGSWLVQDTKLARHARVTALLQLAAYAEQLERIGVRPTETVELLLGDGSVSEHRLSDIRPVYRKRRERLLQIIGERLADASPVAWGDPRYTVCGRCDTCEAEVQAHRDLLLVAGMRVTQRARLATAGIRTIDELAASADTIVGVDGIADSTLQGLRTQARLQVSATDGRPPPVDVYNPGALAVLPEPDPGDIFFDFEGDPLYTEGASAGTVQQWGLDYLFGLIEPDGTFRAFWAHSWAEEKQALLDFLDYLRARRAAYPNMHIYHYASYERTHLLSIAARHGVGEDEVDQLLRANALVDLYPLVRKTIRVGSRSYSIKKLEPLYMGDDLRVGEVTNAADSITEYATAMELRSLGRSVEAQRMLDSIADYNTYDCVSTLRLRDWLLARAAERGIGTGGPLPESELDELEPSPLRDALLALAGGVHAGGQPTVGIPISSGAQVVPERTADQTAAAFAAAAIDYHRREQKSFWWGHFFRLEYPIDEWQDTRDVLRIDQVRVERDWYREGKQRTDRRELRLRGRLAPGSSIKPGDQAGPFLLYEHPGPFQNPGTRDDARAYRPVRVLEVADDGSILVEETLLAGVAPYRTEPIALAPAAPPSAGQQKPAIDEWAQAIVDSQSAGAPAVESHPSGSHPAGSHSTGSHSPESRPWPREPMGDILRRVPPRTRAGRLAPAVASDGGADRVSAVAASLLDLDRSYLAVQGPPGTGKTYLGAHVITALVRDHNWKIGVVAQSHAVVENLLSAVVKAGLDPSLVGKVPKANSDATNVLYTPLPKEGQLMFGAEHAQSGFVLGGTAWDFSNPARVPRHSLDLLVVDEAGQFSLASTIAASVGARNLLLLGDPQQLPQVSQGTHPEPIDQSALGWVSAGHDVLPPDLGYFLAESRRMHPAVTAPVSELSYEGQLHAHPVASSRSLAGVEPGLHAVPVEHVGNSIESPEEASVVVSLVRSVLGTRWTDPTEDRYDEPITEADLIVVTPYNAQLAVVRQALVAAGFDAVRVGTVDKFQGQEAAISIVSLAASSADDVPRGMSFLIMKNRLNVAISRAKWAAYLVYSPALTGYLPVTPAGVTELSAFITLVEAGE